MKSFIRCVWGSRDLHKEDHFAKNFSALQNEYITVSKNPYMRKDFIVYTLGEDNHKHLEDLGFNSFLVDKSNHLFDPNRRIWLHKVYLMEAAMRDFDEIIYLDWDTQPFKPLPPTLWDDLRKKDSFQAPLFKYCSVKMPHRDNPKNERFAARVLPSGAFVYISDKSIPTKLMTYEKQEGLRDRWLDEIYYGAYTDEIYGGWKSIQFYRDHFEPECCNIRRGLFNKESAIFGHPKRRV
ncbi:MAG: hypothetical protein WC119_02205 [Synergistaceae bacterium]